VVGHARDQLRIERLLGITDPGNARSIALLAKLGLTFIEHKVLPPDNRPTNIYRMDLL